MPPEVSNDFFPDSISCLLGRLYYLQLGLHESLLREAGFDKIRPGMCNVICALADTDGETISKIASKILVAKSTMTGTVDRLKKSGYIKVEISKKDRRAQILRLTAKGKKAAPKLQQVMQELEAQACAKLSANDNTKLRKLLKKAIASIE